MPPKGPPAMPETVNPPQPETVRLWSQTACEVPASWSPEEISARLRVIADKYDAGKMRRGAVVPDPVSDPSPPDAIDLLHAAERAEDAGEPELAIDLYLAVVGVLKRRIECVEVDHAPVRDSA